MENKKRRYTNHPYIEGSAVRKLQPEFDYDTERVRQPDRKKKVAPKRRVKRDQAPSIDFVSLIFLTVAILITGYVCIQYLQVQASITSMSKEIAKKESAIAELKNENNIALDSITTSIDLEHIYKVATKELGMVHAKKDQIISYDSTKSDSVKQYGDIPKKTEKGILDSILGKE